MSRRAFTLVELIVTSVIGVLVAGAVVSSVSSLQRARASSIARQQAYGRSDAAASRIALDLSNAVRHYELTFARVLVVNGGAPGAETDELLILANASRPVRGEDGIAEGSEVEVQYRIRPGVVGGAASLWRRSDPAFDLYLDAGGVASTVASGVTALSIQAFDGSAWFDSWDSDSDGMPHAVRVVVSATSDDRRTTSVARRLVAIDRVPIPLETTEEEDSGGTTPAGGAR
ncbi:MAG: type II secretion system protein GspJ [Phycisphaerales bacterium]